MSDYAQGKGIGARLAIRGIHVIRAERMRVLCGLRVVAAVGMLLLAAAVTGSADESRLIPNLPRLALFSSSHSTAAAEVMTFHGVKRELPHVVLIGGLEARIYRCECGKGIDLWDIAAGVKQWAGAEGLKVESQARVLRGGDDSNRLDFSQYREAIDAGRPVVLTYSLDEASAKGMEASFRSQERVSVVGVGYQEASQDRYVVALLPLDYAKEKRFERLMAQPGVKQVDTEGLLLIPWDIQSGNLIATFVEVVKD